METIVGIKGKDFVMLAADSTHPHSIMVLKDGKYLCLIFLRVINSTMTCKKNNFIYTLLILLFLLRCKQNSQNIRFINDCCNWRCW